MSRMFLNQVSSRELFTGGRDKRHSQCSENSQFMYQNSQIELSENSQDVNYSQPLSGEISGSEGRKMFDRYMTKRTNSETSFKSTPAKQAFNQGTASFSSGMSHTGKQPLRQSFQQQIMMNKSKAKERDDRDMLGTVVSTVKECSDEVKDSIKYFQQNIEQVSDTSNEKFSALANSIFDALTENFEKIFKTMKERDDKRSKLHEMEKEITLRDAKIEALQTMLEKQHSEKEKQLVDSLNNIINSHHQETTDKLEKLKETAHHQADNQQQLLDHHRQQREIMDIHHQQYQNMYSVRHEEIKNGIVSELQQFRQDLENHKKQLEDFYSNQLSTSQYKSMKEIQYHLSTGLDKQMQQTQHNSREICNYQISQFSDICKSQQDAHERFFKAQMKEQTILRMEENEQMANHLEMISLKKMNEINDMQIHYKNKTLNTGQDVIPKNIQDQLNEMHRKYTEELAKLRKAVESERSSKQDSQSVYSLTASRNQDVQHTGSDKDFLTHKFENKQHTGSQHSNSELIRQSKILSEINGDNLHYENNTSKKFSFVSPGCRSDLWNAKSVFSKINPSPVAAVLPQPHSNENLGQCENILWKKRGKQKKNYGQPSRKSQRLNRRESDTENETSDASQKFETGIGKTDANQNTQKPFSVVYSTTQVNDFGVSRGRQPGKAIVERKENSSLFKVPQFSQNSHNETKNNSANVSSRGNFSVTKPISSFVLGTIEKQQTTYENVFPVRPNTYSVNNLRKSTPSVTHFWQQSGRFSGHKTEGGCVKDQTTWNLNSKLQQKTGSVYDFSESPDSHQKSVKESGKRYAMQLSNRQISHSESSSSSTESSPSLSITKMMIHRKIRCSRKTDQEASQEKRHNKQELSDDFLSTPNMEDNSNKSDKWENQSVTSNYRRGGEKRKLFNFDLGQELMAIKKAFKV